MEIDDLFKGLFEVLSEYHAAHDLSKLPVKVDLLVPILAKRTGLTQVFVEAYDLANGATPKEIYGRLLIHDEGTGVYADLGGPYARIQIPSATPLSMKRLAVCKELWQAVLDQAPETKAGDVKTLVSLSEWLLADDSFQVPFAPGWTEQAAELLALETLFPYELRSRPEFMDKYDAEEISAEDMADIFKIPVDYVVDGLAAHYFSWVGANRGTDLIEIK